MEIKVKRGRPAIDIDIDILNAVMQDNNEIIEDLYKYQVRKCDDAELVKVARFKLLEPYEQMVLVEWSKGLSYRQIADAYGISKSSVNNILKIIQSKL